jgi:hypothetical protein
VTAARWDLATASLAIDLNLLPTDVQATVWNTQTGELILVADNTQNGVILRDSQLSTIPCEITVVAGARFQNTLVSNSGVACSTSLGVPFSITSQLPDMDIRSPETDVTIPVGGAVLFSASFAGGYSYLWQFDGAAPDSIQRIVGNVVFNQPGIYDVSLTVTNAAGLRDPVPAVRRITVTP